MALSVFPGGTGRAEVVGKSSMEEERLDLGPEGKDGENLKSKEKALHSLKMN